MWSDKVDAHAVFVGAPASVVADNDVSLTMNVPHERDDATYNVGVAIRLPEGWGGVACQAKPTWTCTIGIESARTVIRYTKDAGADPAEDETFLFTVHAATTPGTVSFQTLQTYNTGEVVAWIADPGSDEPAPNLQVTAAPPTAPPTRPPPVAPTPSEPEPTNPTVAAPPTVAPTVAPVTQSTAATSPPSTVAPSTSTSVLPTTSSSIQRTTSTVASSAPTETTVNVGSAVTKPPETGSGGGNTAAIVAVVVVILAAGAAGSYIYLRRRQPTNSPA